MHRSETGIAPHCESQKGIRPETLENVRPGRMKTMRTLTTPVVLGLAGLITFAALMNACTKSGADDGSAERLAERVQEVWQCRVDGDYARKYDMMSPDIRDRVSKPEFMSAKGYVLYYSYEVDKLEIDGDEAMATVTYTWKANHPLFAKTDPKENTTTDPWVRIDGEWYMKYRTPSITGAEGEVQPPKDDDID